jgi:D-alanyl-D-alanine carboxypeptidase
MHTTRHAAFSLMLLILSGCAIGLGDPTPPTREAGLAEVERYVGAIVRDGDPPSVSVAVLDADRVVYQRAFGSADAPRRIGATPASTYRWFSITKLFTAVAILQLAEAGRLDLDAPAARYLPVVNDVFGARARVMTIERLLSHSSGIGDVGTDIFSWLHVQGPHPRERDLLERRLADYDDFDEAHVGRGHYSNLGYILLGGVIEAVTGRAYTEYVQTEILDRLGMTSTGFHYDGGRFAPGTRHAVGSHPHDFIGFLIALSLDMDTLERESAQGRYWFNAFHPDQSAPSGLVGPSGDALRFARAILRGGELDGKRILSQRSVAAMSRPRVDLVESPAGDLDGFSLGHAWFIGHDAQGRRVLCHGGGAMAFTAMLMLWPDEGRAVFVAANGSYLDGAMGRHVAEAYGALDW